MQQHCSPVAYSKLHDNSTCLSMKDLKLIAEDFNNYNKTNNNPQNIIKIHKTKSKLYTSIREALKKYCLDKEHCWIDLEFISHQHKSILDKKFRPKKPKSWYKNNRTWLNTFDILHVMKQYEYLYRNFTFLGVFPIDFQDYFPGSNTCIGNNMCGFHIQNILPRKKRFAMVLNLDRHNQSGSHWVAVYCNLNSRQNNFGIYYYDSVANHPGREVRIFMDKIKEQVSELYPHNVASRFEVKFNQIQKQYKNTECGMFSMIFITQMLKNHKFYYICSHMRKDDSVNEIRDILYRPSMS